MAQQSRRTALHSWNLLNKEQRVQSVGLKVESALMADTIGVMNKPFWWILDFVVTAAFVAKCRQQQQLRVVCQNLIVMEFSGGGKGISANYANLSYSVVGQEFVHFLLLHSLAFTCSPKLGCCAHWGAWRRTGLTCFWFPSRTQLARLEKHMHWLFYHKLFFRYFNS